MSVTPLRPGAGPQPGAPAPPTDGDEPTSSLAERVGRIEAAMEGIKHGQNLILAAVGVGFALMIALFIYGLTRIDSIPGEFRDTTQTIASAITATASKPTQVVVVPAESARR